MSDVIMGQLTNCDSLYIAPVEEDTLSAFVAGTPEYLAPLGEIKEDPKASMASSDFDGTTMFHYASEGAAENTLTIPGLTEKRTAELTGKPYDSTKGIVFDTGDLSRGKCYALGYRLECGSDNATYFKYRWFLKGKFILSATSAKTKGEKVDPQSQEVTFYPQKTIHKWSIPDPQNAGQTISDGLKVVKTDTTDPTFTTESSWFSQVQTPDTIGAPSALSFTAVPANNATGVLASAKPVLTFNNVIKDYSGITLVSNNAIVAATVSADSTGKIITVTPGASLTASGVYTIILSGITDVFGQVLATQAIKFTVAS